MKTGHVMTPGYNRRVKHPYRVLTQQLGCSKNKKVIRVVLECYAWNEISRPAQSKTRPKLQSTQDAQERWSSKWLQSLKKPWGNHMQRIYRAFTNTWKLSRSSTWTSRIINMFSLYSTCKQKFHILGSKLKQQWNCPISNAPGLTWGFVSYHLICQKQDSL